MPGEKASRDLCEQRVQPYSIGTVQLPIWRIAMGIRSRGMLLVVATTAIFAPKLRDMDLDPNYMPSLPEVERLEVAESSPGV